MNPPLLHRCAALGLAAILTSPLAATNGMNLEGYGPVATALGGASLAYDNGTAGLINNPATLGLMPGRARLDVAFGVLGPDIQATSPATSPNIFNVPANQRANSTANAFYMPAFGYTRRSGDWVYGLGVMGQGGMGCEYHPDTWRGLGFNLPARTEVSVGRVVVPVAYRVNERLQIAATADFIWAGMDLQMAMSGPQFFDLVLPTSQRFGRAGGSLVNSFGQMLQTLPAGSSVDYALFNFANQNDFTGDARGYGYGGKVGLLYTASPALTLGLTYHTESQLEDMTTGKRALAFQLNVPGLGQMAQSLTGKYRINNFQWPAMLGAGLAYRPAGRWMLVADLREIFWRDVLRDFQLNFTADTSPANGPFAGQALDAVLFQRWDNQAVVQLGAAFEATARLTLRLGANFSTNPVPGEFLNCLFPAIVQHHATAGFGWKFSDRSSVDFSTTYGFKVANTNGAGAKVEHRQLNGQVMYSFQF